MSQDARESHPSSKLNSDPGRVISDLYPKIDVWKFVRHLPNQLHVFMENTTAQTVTVTLTVIVTQNQTQLQTPPDLFFFPITLCMCVTQIVNKRRSAYSGVHISIMQMICSSLPPQVAIKLGH